MRMFQHEFFKFVVVGVINTATYYILYLAMLNLLHFYYMAAHFIAFAISFVVSFFLNTSYTYKVKPTWGKFIRYPLTQLANTIITSALLFIFVDLFSLNASLAPIAALFFTVPITFFMTSRILKVS